MLAIDIQNIDQSKEGRPAKPGMRPLGVATKRPRGAVGFASATWVPTTTKLTADQS
jgi:hypothetical protein